MINFIFFDMDGVLVEAKEWHYDSLNLALKEMGFKEIPIEDHLKNFDGLPTKVKLSKYQEFYGIKFTSDDINNICNLKQKFTLLIAEQKLKFDNEKYEMISDLKNKGYKVACCSNSIRSSVQFFLTKIGIYNLFDVVLSNEDISNPKPAPDIYLLAMKLLNAKPNESLIFEDNENGIKAAKASLANLSIVSSPSILNKNYVNEVIKKYAKK